MPQYPWSKTIYYGKTILMFNYSKLDELDLVFLLDEEEGEA